MCWSKESSFIGFAINLFFNVLHINKNTNKYLPFLMTITLTQLFDFLVYSGYNKNILNKLLSIDILLQIFFLYYVFEIPFNFSCVIFILIIIKNYNWKPYDNFNICEKKPIDWNESNITTKYYAIVWLLIPFYFTFCRNNIKECFTIIFSYLLLEISPILTLKYGSVGKNWCMLGVLLNIYIYFTNYENNYFALNIL